MEIGIVNLYLFKNKLLVEHQRLIIHVKPRMFNHCFIIVLFLLPLLQIAFIEAVSPGQTRS